MTLMVVLMCFVGYDYQRIIDGVNYWRIREPLEAIYLFYDKKRDVYGIASQRNARDLERALTFAGSKPKRIGINPQDYEDVFTSLYKALKVEVIDNKRRVFIDATSTTKEAYGAAVTVSLMFPNVSIYIVPPAERGWYIPEPGTPEFEEWFSRVRMRKGTVPQEIYLPGNRLEHPNLDEIRILVALIMHGGRAESIKSIIKWCGDDPSNPAIKNRYSRLVRKLVSRGLIFEEPSTKTKKLRLTGFGRVFARALKSIIQMPSKMSEEVQLIEPMNFESSILEYARPIARSGLESTSSLELSASRREIPILTEIRSPTEFNGKIDIKVAFARLAKEFRELSK